MALVTEREKILLVDSRYTEAAKAEATEFTVVEFGGGKRNSLLASLLEDVTCLAYEEEAMSVAEYEALKKDLPPLTWQGASQELTRLRMVKSPEELSLIERAEQIGVEALEQVLPMIRPGVRENEIAAELEYQMRKRGAEGTSFETIVVSGVKSSMPHGRPDEKKLETGDFVTLDFGCRYRGYCSDMTRTVVLGKATEEQKKIYETVRRAQEAGLAAIRPGMTGREADAEARAVIEEAGYGSFFGHSLGHGVGLEIHELPNLSPKSEIPLEAGMVVTCEPGIYLSGIGGVRIEDLVRVTQDGNCNLTRWRKDLLEL